LPHSASDKKAMASGAAILILRICHGGCDGG
jgi:hypothetical protein